VCENNVCEFFFSLSLSLCLSLSFNFEKRFWISFVFRVSVCVESSEIFMNSIRFENR